MASPIRQRLLDLATDIATTQLDEMTFSPSVVCQTCLPAAKPPDIVRLWEVRQGRACFRWKLGVSSIHEQDTSKNRDCLWRKAQLRPEGALCSNSYLREAPASQLLAARPLMGSVMSPMTPAILAEIVPDLRLLAANFSRNPQRGISGRTGVGRVLQDILLVRSSRRTSLYLILRWLTT